MDRKLLASLEASPSNVRFKDLKKFVKQLGWTKRNTKGSHHIFTHPDDSEVRDDYPRPLNLQRSKKSDKAKPEQVREVLKRARRMGLIGIEEKGENP